MLFVLNRFFDERVEKEFRKKLHAEKSQIEILIKNRIDSVKKVLEDLSTDNAIMGTMMLNNQSNLLGRIRDIEQTYPPESGVYPFIQKGKTGPVIPQSYKNLSKEMVLHALNVRPRGDVLTDKNGLHLVWLFSQPIAGNDGDMGTATIFYDMMKDSRLSESIKSEVKGDLKILYGDQLIPLGAILPKTLDPEFLDDTGDNNQDFRLVGDLAYSQIMTNRNLYYVSTARDLLSERKEVTLLMWIFSVLVLAVSVLISAFLAEKMVRPLKEMTRKAIRISEGNDIPLNFERNNEYWEFDQLSEAFNTMFAHLKEAEERSRYQELLENVDDAVYIIDEQGFIIEANCAAYEPLEYSREEFFSLQLSALVPLKDYQNIISLDVEPGSDSRSRKVTIETVHLGKGERSIPVEIHSRPITYMGKRVTLNVARDITKRIEAEKQRAYLESQLTRAQKMESMGTMAGCIAHDFNNILQSIILNSELAQFENSDNPMVGRRAEEVLKASRRATDLVKQILTFSRQSELELRPLRISLVIKEALKMLRSSLPSTIEIKTNIMKKVILLKCRCINSR